MKINLFTKRKLIERAKEGSTITFKELELKKQLEEQGLKVEHQKIYPVEDPQKPDRKYVTADLLARKGKEKLAIHVDGQHHNKPQVKAHDKEVEREIGFYGHDQFRVTNKEVTEGSALSKILGFFKWIK